MHETVDIQANRAARKWTRRELAGRLIWEAAGGLFALSPRQLWGWRNFLIRLFGGKVGRKVRIFPTAKIAVPWNLEIGDEAGIGDGALLYSLGKICIGRQATISQYAQLCAGTHDYSDPAFPLIKEGIAVGQGAWVAANAFVGPGVRVGSFAIVGAAAVVTKDVPEWTIWAGNPARQISCRAKS